MSWVLPLDIGLVMGLILAWPVLAFAMTFRLLNFPDLTIEGSFPTGAAVSAVALLHGWSLTSAFVVAVLAGACLGATTAIIHLRLGVNKFLAGVIVVAMSYTFDLRVMDSSNIGLIRQTSLFDIVANLNEFFGTTLQIGTILLLAGILAIGFALLIVGINTIWGIRLRVAGSNPQYARAIGISVPLSLIVGLATANGLVAGSGMLLAMYQGFSDVSMGQGALIIALAGMSIGERVVPERHLSVPTFVMTAAVVGSIIYQVAIAYALRLGLAAPDLKLATAIFVIGVIAFRLRKHDDGFLEAIR